MFHIDKHFFAQHQLHYTRRPRNLKFGSLSNFHVKVSPQHSDVITAHSIYSGRGQERNEKRKSFSMSCTILCCHFALFAMKLNLYLPLRYFNHPELSAINLSLH